MPVDDDPSSSGILVGFDSSSISHKVSFDSSSPSSTSNLMEEVGRKKRTYSSSSSSSNEFLELEEHGVEPLTLDDIGFKPSYVHNSDEDHSYDPTEGGKFFNVAMTALYEKKNKKKIAKMSKAKKMWKIGFKKIKDRGDPWEVFHLCDFKAEKAIRHRYNPLSQQWVKDECLVKLDTESFAHGAMRECFRMKKIPDSTDKRDWARDSNNFVAKRYMEEPDRDTYFQDVKLQMDAKLWGEEYDRHNPPKKIDIVSMAVIELSDHPEAPLYHIEHYIDGDYVKYNSNSGFVMEGTSGSCRMTPQAFSHFTFERSGHELVVVDIQGVGDLYTDPQIHTASGEEYGDGNLGTRGMALFFHSHSCNQICNSLGLTQFDLSDNELNGLKKGVSDREVISNRTRVRADSGVICCETPSSVERADFRRLFRARSGSSGYADFDSRPRLTSNSEDTMGHSPLSRSISECEDPMVFTVEEVETEEEEDAMRRKGSTATSIDSGLGMPGMGRKRKPRTDSSRLTVCEGDTEDKEQLMQERISRVSRPSCVQAEVARAVASQREEEEVDSVLGRVHLDLAVYHETCRFNIEVHDKASALFHLKAAADCGNIQALVAISQLFTGRPNDILPALDQGDVAELMPIKVKDNVVEDIGLDYMVIAARQGDTPSMLYLAKAFDSGLNLGNDRQQNYEQALQWYRLALEKNIPQPYLTQARVAEILLLEESGCYDPLKSGEIYSEAAEAAMEDMKGKLASKYYTLAEEAWSLVED